VGFLLGLVRLVRLGLDWFGLAWLGLLGLVWSGLVWFGPVRFGLVWSGLVWFGLVWSGLVFFGVPGDVSTTLVSHCLFGGDVRHSVLSRSLYCRLLLSLSLSLSPLPCRGNYTVVQVLLL